MSHWLTLKGQRIWQMTRTLEIIYFCPNGWRADDIVCKMWRGRSSRLHLLWMLRLRWSFLSIKKPRNLPRSLGMFCRCNSSSNNSWVTDWLLLRATLTVPQRLKRTNPILTRPSVYTSPAISAAVLPISGDSVLYTSVPGGLATYTYIHPPAHAPPPQGLVFLCAFKRPCNGIRLTDWRINRHPR